MDGIWYAITPSATNNEKSAIRPQTPRVDRLPRIDRTILSVGASTRTMAGRRLNLWDSRSLPSSRSLDIGGVLVDAGWRCGG